MTTFIEGQQLSNEIRNLFGNATNGEDIFCAVAFWGCGMQDIIDSCNANHIKIICNLDSGATNPYFLESIRTNEDIEIKNISNLHAKVYIGHQTAIVTSANASSNGLKDNIEAGVLLDDDQIDSIREWFDNLWEKASDITGEDIKRAKEKWNKRSHNNRQFDITEQLEILKDKNYPDALDNFIRGQLEIVANNFQIQNQNTIYYYLIKDVLQAKISIAGTEPLIKFRFIYRDENDNIKCQRRFWGTIMPTYIRFAVDIFNPTGKKWNWLQERRIRPLKKIKRITNAATNQDIEKFEEVIQPYLEYFGISEIDKLTFSGRFDHNEDWEDLAIGFRITNDFDGLMEMVKNMAQTMPRNAFRRRHNDHNNVLYCE